ncbi:MAG TPA: SDR family NAD(P)-dependent oxidoreductase [Gammaproteobacteria bacterium]|jgi:NAD(P)-dependent dehydrogenase (short-subunit alcohol dehydrogenase family)|nr:SDR family NAD(P)-dependent oxidoreductase [Gammaproteobacteria bacterium]
METQQKRLAWITGGGTGIGRALALSLAADGWQVVVSGRRLEPLAETATAAKPGQVHAWPLDVSDLNNVRQAVPAIEAQHGAIALAVLNAGIYTAVKLVNFKAEILADHMRVNYQGVVNCMDPLIPAMRSRRQGHLVLVASVAGYRGLPLASAYGPTKAALINLAESLKYMLEREGIRISVCNPGFVETPLTENNKFPMPFLMKVDVAAEALKRGIYKGKFEIAFPTRFVLLLKFFRCLPYALYFPIIKKFTGR